MATGSGKTYTAVSAAYRLLKFGGAKRILFLVDRGNLGKQTEDEFANYTPPDDTRKFPTLYTVQRIRVMLQAYLGHPLERLQAQNETPPRGWAGAFEKVAA